MLRISLFSAFLGILVSANNHSDCEDSFGSSYLVNPDLPWGPMDEADYYGTISCGDIFTGNTEYSARHYWRIDFDPMYDAVKFGSCNEQTRFDTGFSVWIENDNVSRIDDTPCFSRFTRVAEDDDGCDSTTRSHLTIMPGNMSEEYTSYFQIGGYSYNTGNYKVQMTCFNYGDEDNSSATDVPEYRSSEHGFYFDETVSGDDAESSYLSPPDSNQYGVALNYGQVSCWDTNYGDTNYNRIYYEIQFYGGPQRMTFGTCNPATRYDIGLSVWRVHRDYNDNDKGNHYNDSENESIFELVESDDDGCVNGHETGRATVTIHPMYLDLEEYRYFLLVGGYGDDSGYFRLNSRCLSENETWSTEYPEETDEDDDNDFFEYIGDYTSSGFLSPPDYMPGYGAAVYSGDLQCGDTIWGDTSYSRMLFGLKFNATLYNFLKLGTCNNDTKYDIGLSIWYYVGNSSIGFFGSENFSSILVDGNFTSQYDRVTVDDDGCDGDSVRSRIIGYLGNQSLFENFFLLVSGYQNYTGQFRVNFECWADVNESRETTNEPEQLDDHGKNDVTTTEWIPDQTSFSNVQNSYESPPDSNQFGIAQYAGEISCDGENMPYMGSTEDGRRIYRIDISKYDPNTMEFSFCNEYTNYDSGVSVWQYIGEDDDDDNGMYYYHQNTTESPDNTPFNSTGFYGSAFELLASDDDGCDWDGKSMLEWYSGSVKPVDQESIYLLVAGYRDNRGEYGFYLHCYDTSTTSEMDDDSDDDSETTEVGGDNDCQESGYLSPPDFSKFGVAIHAGKISCGETLYGSTDNKTRYLYEIDLDDENNEWDYVRFGTCNEYTNYDTGISTWYENVDYNSSNLDEEDCDSSAWTFAGGDDDGCGDARSQFQAYIGGDFSFFETFHLLVSGYGYQTGDFQINMQCWSEGDNRSTTSSPEPIEPTGKGDSECRTSNEYETPIDYNGQYGDANFQGALDCGQTIQGDTSGGRHVYEISMNHVYDDQGYPYIRWHTCNSRNLDEDDRFDTGLSLWVSKNGWNGSTSDFLFGAATTGEPHMYGYNTTESGYSEDCSNFDLITSNDDYCGLLSRIDIQIPMNYPGSIFLQVGGYDRDKGEYILSMVCYDNSTYFNTTEFATTDDDDDGSDYYLREINPRAERDGDYYRGVIGCDDMFYGETFHPNDNDTRTERNYWLIDPDDFPDNLIAFIFDTCDNYTDFDTGISFWQAGNSDNYTILVDSDDDSCAPQSKLIVRMADLMEEGYDGPWYVQVGGYADSTGKYLLNVECDYNGSIPTDAPPASTDGEDDDDDGGDDPDPTPTEIIFDDSCNETHSSSYLSPPDSNQYGLANYRGPLYCGDTLQGNTDDIDRDYFSINLNDILNLGFDYIRWSTCGSDKFNESDVYDTGLALFVKKSEDAAGAFNYDASGERDSNDTGCSIFDRVEANDDWCGTLSRLDVHIPMDAPEYAYLQIGGYDDNTGRYSLSMVCYNNETEFNTTSSPTPPPSPGPYYLEPIIPDKDREYLYKGELSCGDVIMGETSDEDLENNPNHRHYWGLTGIDFYESMYGVLFETCANMTDFDTGLSLWQVTGSNRSARLLNDNDDACDVQSRLMFDVDDFEDGFGAIRLQLGGYSDNTGIYQLDVKCLYNGSTPVPFDFGGSSSSSEIPQSIDDSDDMSSTEEMPGDFSSTDFEGSLEPVSGTVSSYHAFLAGTIAFISIILV